MRVLTSIALALVLSGCLTTAPSDDTSEPDPPAARPTLDDVLARIGDGPDGERMLSDLEEFVLLAPRRYDNMFEHDAARDWLEAAMVDAGLNVTRHKFTAPGQGVPEALEGQNLLGVLPGRSDTIVMFGAHYDSAVSGFGGAYDDGAGTLITIELARAMADYEWEHTFVFALWDQEEAGLEGSKAYVEEALELDTDILLYVNFDMTGISWPAKVLGVRDQPIRSTFGGDGEETFAEWVQVAADHLGYPDIATTTDTGLGTGSSDHGSFRAADMPAAWVRGALIGTYPGYHNADTVQTMIADVGGDRADLVAGMDAVLELMFAFAFIVDGLASGA